MIRDYFHGEMRFAISGAAPHWSADARRVFGINPIHVERDVIASGAASSHAESFLHDGAHAAFVDVAHGEDFDPGFADVFFFEVVDVADADEHAIFRLHFGREVVDVTKFGGRKAHDRRERHAVNFGPGGGGGPAYVVVVHDSHHSHFLPLSP